MIKFNGINCVVVKEQYTYGGTCLRLIDVSDGMPIATCTVHIEGYIPPEPNCVLIKDYSENEGMLDALVCAGVVEETGFNYNSGFVTVKEVRIIKEV